MRSASQLPLFILAGGLGRRLAGVVSDRPKPMAPVAGKPFAEWLLLAFRQQGVERFVFCTGHMSDAIAGYFGDGSRWDVTVEYSREAEPLGTGGALALASRTVAADRCLAANGDSYCTVDLARLLRLHEQRSARATLWLVPVDTCSRYGSVDVATDGQIRAFREKSSQQQSGLVNAGIYVFEAGVLDAIPPGRPVSLETEVLPALAGRGLYGVVGEGPLLDIGTPESYATAEDFFLSAHPL